LICDIHNPDGTPFEGCPRSNLKRILNRCQQHGFTYNVGPELEFFLFRKDANGMVTTFPHDSAGYYDLAPDDLAEDVRGRIVETLESLGFNIEASHHEVATGQHEIDFQYADALTTADNVITFKAVTRKIASEYGLHATFMPKPVHGINGSGMHCNQSLSLLNGDNAFLDEGGEHQLSRTCLRFIGGLLHNMRGVVAVTNPTVNSYKRLVPGYEAPVYIAWSPGNRSALIRVPVKRGKSTRIELRCPDPSCMLTAGLSGIESESDPPAPLSTNIYNLDEAERAERAVGSLPGSLWEALEEFKPNQVVKEALGEHIFNEFVKAKTMEWDSFKTYVTQWETDQYMYKF
jgi:glutamine synthetase